MAFGLDTAMAEGAKMAFGGILWDPSGELLSQQGLKLPTTKGQLRVKIQGNA